MSNTDRLWLPPSARPNAIEDGHGNRAVPMTTEQLESVVGPGASVFLTPSAIGYWTLEADSYGRETVPAVTVGFEHLRQQVVDGTARVDYHGITAGLGTSAGDYEPFPDGPRLLLAMKNDGVTYLIGPLTGAPEDWYPRLMQGFAVVFDVMPGTEMAPYIVTGPLKKGELTVPPPQPGSDAPEPVGRNMPCPCGSGLKFKRCCG